MDTEYTNTRGYPIEVSIEVDHPSGTSYRQSRLYVGGEIVGETYLSASTNNVCAIITLHATVPAGSTYQLQKVGGSPAELFRWAELY